MEIGDGPFRGSEARAEGELDVAARSRAAYCYVAGRGVLGGWSAAAVVRHGVVAPADRWRRAECLLTSPLVTAWDLARRLDLVEAVVAVDALAGVGAPGHPPFRPEALLALRERWPGARGSRGLDEVVRLADPRAASPPETRLRLALTFAGIPPQVQYPIRDRFGRIVFDMAYPEARLGVEYDGEVHRALGYDDRRRDLRAGALGWHVMRFGASAISVSTDEAVRLITAQRLQRLSIMTPAWSQT